MNKNERNKWVLITYDTLSTSLIGGLRLNRLKTYLKQRNEKPLLISRSGLDSDDVDISVENHTFFTSNVIRKIFNLICIPDSTVFWSLKVFKLLREKDIVNGNIIVTSSPPHGIHLTGILLKKYCSKSFKWVADFRDPFTFNPGYKRRYLKKKLDVFYESKVLSLADLILFNTDFDQEQYVGKYPELKLKSIVVRNGFTKDSSDKVISEKKRYNNRVVYAGGSYHGRVPERLNEFFELLNSMIEISCDYYGEYHQSLEESKYINYKGKVEAKEIPALLCLYKYGIIYLPPEYKTSGRITQKMYDYIGSRVMPIMINPSVEMVGIKDKLNIGFCIDEDEFNEKWSELLNFFQTDIYIWPNDDIINANYSREKQFSRLISALTIK